MQLSLWLYDSANSLPVPFCPFPVDSGCYSRSRCDFTQGVISKIVCLLLFADICLQVDCLLESYQANPGVKPAQSAVAALAQPSQCGVP
jgi:hypothetical protein